MEQSHNEADRAEVIATLNDQCRKQFAMGDRADCRSVVTRGVDHLLSADTPELHQENARQLIDIISNFSDFNDSNNPYGEREFFEFQFKGKKLFFKIDYYDRDLRVGSDDPADPEVTCRVMTVMLSSEY